MEKKEELLHCISNFITLSNDVKINLQELYVACKKLCISCDFHSVTLNQIVDNESKILFFCSVSSKKDPKKSSSIVSDIILHQKTLFIPILGKKILWGYVVIENFLFELDEIAKSVLSVFSNALAQQYIFHSLDGKIANTTYEDILLDYQHNISNEAILMISYDKNSCYYNNAFAQLWKIETTTTNDYSAILKHLIDQIVNSEESFIATFATNKSTSATSIIETKQNGSIHYYTTELTNIENRVIGRLWVFKQLNNIDHLLLHHKNNDEIIQKFMDSLNGIILHFKKNGYITEMNSFGNHMIKRLGIQSPIITIHDIIPKYTLDGIHQWNKIDRFLQHPEIPYSDVIELYSSENDVISLLFSISIDHMGHDEDYILIGKEVSPNNYFVGNDNILTEIAALLIMSKTPNYVHIISKIQKMFPCDSVIISKFFSNNKNEIYAIENLFFDFLPLVKQIRSIFKTDISPLFYEYNNDQIIAHPLLDNEKKLVGALIFYKPYLMQKMITEDKYLIGIVTELISSAIATEHTQQEIMYREELLTTILESISEALIALDNDGHPLYINKYAKQLIDKIILNEHHLLNEKNQASGNSKECPDFFLFINNLLHKENINNNTILHFLDAEGKTQYIHHKLYPVKQDNDEVIGNVMILKNFDSSTFSHESLEKVDATDFSTILAANLFHDINAIISDIIGNLNLIKIHLDESSPIQNAVQDAENSCMEATKLNAKLKSYAYTSEPTISQYNINDIVTELLNNYTTPSKYILNKNIYPFPITIPIDKMHFSEIVNHLLDNAFESMPEGGEITIVTELQHISESNKLSNNNQINSNFYSYPMKPGSYAKLIIQDTGYGIDKECMPYIYDPFFSTKPKHTGIGLAKVYTYINKYQGNIEIKSNLLEGTIVTCYFPLHENPITVATTIQSKTLASENSTNNHDYKANQKNADPLDPKTCDVMNNTQNHDNSKKQILIMDDDEAILKMLKKALQKNGYYIDIATHGDEAIEKYRSKLLSGNPYDLVIMDILNPGKKGGIETIKDLLSLYPEIKAILSSHYTNAASLADYKNYGFKGVLAKPYHFKELNNLIQQLINKNN